MFVGSHSGVEHSVLCGVGSGSVSDRSAIARHEASFFFFFKPAEWPEQLRSVTSVPLGAVRCRVQIRLCTEQRVREKKTSLDLFLLSVFNV